MSYLPQTRDTLKRNDFYKVQGQLMDKGFQLSVVSNKFGQLLGYRCTKGYVRFHRKPVLTWTQVMEIHSIEMGKPKLGSLNFALQGM